MKPMHPSGAVFLLLIVAIANSLHIQPVTGGACVPHEREALLTFKWGITGDPASRLASWHQGEQDCCRWRGVRCSNRTGHVVVLHLRNPQVDNPDQTALSGQISPSLLSLHHLRRLDLSLNNLSGPSGVMPEFLGHFKSLRYLNLSGMPFSGRVPPQLGNLSKLHYLDVSNPLGRSLYSTDISWLSNLPLRFLNMAWVNLATATDWAHVVNMIPYLEVIRLPGCLTSANQSLPHLNLTNLEVLDLSWNDFLHPVASCWFWNLTSLRYLELVHTGLYGQMPDALGAMTSLQVLKFSESVSSIDIMMASMKNLCNLEILDLNESNMNGDIIELLPQCSNGKLKELHLGNNHFTGVLPDTIGRGWSSLLILELGNNQLTGHVPSGMDMLSNLRILDLSRNQLTGPLPSEIGMLSNLTDMRLSNNNLSGVITHEHFAGLASLRSIDLSNNKDLKIEVRPGWLPPFSLEFAAFRSCKMGPLFPVWLQYQVDIYELDITNTSIFDRLPDWFATTFSNARYLYMYNNGINGTLPTNLKNMTSLQALNLYSNHLTGQIPQLPINLNSLDISLNNLSGPLPSNFGATNLNVLYLSSNQITGHIPQSICKLNLVELELDNNRLEGEFPQCSEPRITRRLILCNNMLSGKLEEILRTHIELEILNLAWNNFTGTIPASIMNIEGLYHLNLAGNSISGGLPNSLIGTNRVVVDPLSGVDTVNISVTMKGQVRYFYNFETCFMVSIDLSSNHLTGRIPEDIAPLGLENFNLSRNNLTGQIPEKIGAIQSLESLDLSGNKICGEIPQSLSNLTFLSFLNLSDNNLTGRIPSGPQLDGIFTQYPHIYDGNIGLCGNPLQTNCTSNSEPKHGDQKIDEDDSMVLRLSFGLGIGYVVGLWVVFCVILFKRSWRLAYFQVFDKAFDKAYVFLVVTWATWARKAPNH
ncbi:unnamed protein product [Urochloa decumbens]|uniref:Leucine-rich repeat-containing N-terminal plant-type domain-containing protein n=1 Tax=Urochloa decumbens TaxID=240449 RepID=A0ABC9AR45_9POAL